MSSLAGAAIAVAIGIFVGLEREHADVAEAPPAGAGGKPREVLLGVRTFALMALFGWLCGALDDRAWLPAVGLLVVTVIVVLQYLRVARDSPGITTEVAAAVTYLLGLLVHRDRTLAVALGLATTVLLISKPWVRRTVPKLRRVELTATIQLAVVLAVVLPLLPTEARDPWHVLSPRKIGLFVVLVAGISFVGYVLARLFGRRRGTALAGLVGGLASSTAVTAAMAEEARRHPDSIPGGQLATLLASSVMFARVLVVTAVINRPLAVSLAIPLAGMAAVVIGASAWRFLVLRGASAAGAPDEPVAVRNPFALLPALSWGLLLCAVLVVSAVARTHFGDRGLYAAAAASGLADVDAITLAVGRHAAGGSLALPVATLAITIAVVANTVVKAAIAVVSGGRRFGGLVAAVFAASMVAGVLLAATR